MENFTFCAMLSELINFYFPETFDLLMFSGEKELNWLKLALSVDSLLPICTQILIKYFYWKNSWV